MSINQHSWLQSQLQFTFFLEELESEIDDISKMIQTKF